MNSTMKDVSAVIMAGGEGVRLRPLTCSMPKPMVPLLCKPVIDYCVELLRDHGVTDIKTTLYYLGDMIESHIGAGERYGVNVTHSRSESPLGTAGSVRQAVAQDKRTHIIVSGDALTDCDLTEALKFHRENSAPITIVLKKVQDPTEYGVVLRDSENRITQFLEKPAKTEALSDLANTGIYIVEPEVIDMIPEGRVFDFSLDLFPRLLENKIPIFGYEMRGYWCDIGDIRQYVKAQRDMLDGKVNFHTNANRTGGIFIEDGANVSKEAHVHAPCYIAKDTEIAPRACVDSYSVVGCGSKVYEGAGLKRSVVMENAIIRERAEIRGAIICSDAQVESEASVFEDSVIGDRSRVGQGASVYNGACVWPDKNIDPRTRVGENIVWGVPKRITCHDSGITGYCDADISPETAVRIGAAFSSMFPASSSFALATDGQRVSSMLKRAMSAGFASQGSDVVSLPHMPYPVFQFAIKHMGLTGGAFIASDTENPHISHITLCDATGTALDSGKRRKLEAAFRRGELRPTTRSEIGIVEEVAGTIKAYEARVLSEVDTEVLKNTPGSVVLDVPKVTYDIITPMLTRLGWRVIPTDSQNGEKLYSQVVSSRAAFGCFLSERETGRLPAVILAGGKSLYGMSLLCALAQMLVRSGRANNLTVPVTFPDEYSRHLMNSGAKVTAVPEEWHRWQRAAAGSNSAHGAFFDPVVAVFTLCEAHSMGDLNSIAEAIPQTFVTERNIPCTWQDVGQALRTLVEEERGYEIEPVDGVKIRTDRGWVLVKASGDLASCRIICSSFNEEYSDELSTLYMDKLNAMFNKKIDK